MSISSATATSTVFPAIRFSADLMLVNKEAIEMFCSEEKGKPAAQG
jgi:hypothetical protein